MYLSRFYSALCLDRLCNILLQIGIVESLLIGSGRRHAVPQIIIQIQGIRYDNVRSAMAEEGLLRQVLKEPELLRDIDVTPEQFSSPLLGRAFAALQRQHAQGQTVTLSNLGEEFTPQEMSHLSQVAQRRDTTLSEQALKDYIRIITEEYANARLSGPEGLLQLAQRKKRMEHGG